MNAGDAMVKTTGRFKATRHRVVDNGKERYSVPFFVEPNYYADIGRYEKELQQSNGSTKVDSITGSGSCEEEPSQYGPWLIKRLKEKNFSDYPSEKKKV